MTEEQTKNPPVDDSKANYLSGIYECTIGGKRRTLRLTLGDLEVLEDRLNVAVTELYERAATDRMKFREMREILQHGLECGGKWAGTVDELREDILVEGHGAHKLNVIRLLNCGLGIDPKKLMAAEEEMLAKLKALNASPSADGSVSEQEF